MVKIMELPLMDRGSPLASLPSGVLSLSSGKACGTGCDSSRTAAHQDPAREEPSVQISFSGRRLNLDAIPSRGLTLAGIDMDLTVECNLRCTYCFKEKWNEHMEEQVAFDTMVWLIHASGPLKELNVAFMGGEPLIRFKLIKKLVPFAKRRAAQHGKSIHFSMTTNGTLVTDEVVEFWRKWGLGFHTSIDGTPDIQDRNRPTTGGRGSSRLLERSVPKILGYQPNTTARCTVVPTNAGALVASYRYFRSLGYQDIAFVPGGQPDWDVESLRVFEEQYLQVCDLLLDDFRAGHPVNLKGIDDYAQAQAAQVRQSHPCGAGRGMVLVDIHGDLWPCHRWNKESEASWRLGSIYEQFNDAIREPLDNPSFIDRLENDCENCCARLTCSGGCPAENLEQTGTVYRRHENACQLTRVWARGGEYVHTRMMAEQNRTYFDLYFGPNARARGEE